MGLKAVRTVGAKAHGVSSDPRSLPLSADVPASMILIAADHAMFRDTLRNLLEQVARPDRVRAGRYANRMQNGGSCAERAGARSFLESLQRKAGNYAKTVVYSVWFDRRGGIVAPPT